MLRGPADTRRIITNAHLAGIWKKALVVAGVPVERHSLHAIRKMAAILVAAMGASSTAVQDLGLWRSSMDTTLRLGILHCACVVGAILLLMSHAAAAHAKDNCQTLTTVVRVTKEKTYEYNGRRKRLFCTGDVTMNKCEGSCMSQVSPSVVHFPGFKKDCKCCRESRLVDKLVMLTQCYDGNSLISKQYVRFFVKNPVECQCFDCAI